MKKLLAATAITLGALSGVPVADAVLPVPVAAAYPIGGVARLWAGPCSVAIWWNNNGTLSAQIMSYTGACKSVNLYVVLAGRTVQAILTNNPSNNRIITTTIPIPPTGGCYVRTHIRSSSVGHAWNSMLFGFPKQVW